MSRGKLFPLDAEPQDGVEMTVTEIATALGVSKQFVSKLIIRALHKLRRYHQAQEGETPWRIPTKKTSSR